MSFNSDLAMIATESAYNIAIRAALAFEAVITAVSSNDHIGANIAARAATDAAFINTSKTDRDTFYNSAINSVNAITRPFIIYAATSANDTCIVRDYVMI